MKENLKTREHHEWDYTNTLENLDEMEISPGKNKNLPKLLNKK